MSISTRNRVPEGVPTGGEYAPELKSEPDIAPIEDSTPDEGRPLCIDDLKYVNRAMAKYVKRYGTESNSNIDYTPEDVQQAAYEQLLAHIRDGKTVRSGEAYVRTIVANSFYQVFRKGVNHRARKLQLETVQREAQLEQVLGHSLTRAQRDRVFEETRMSFDPGHRPSAEALRAARVESHSSYNVEELLVAEGEIGRHLTGTAEDEVMGTMKTPSFGVNDLLDEIELGDADSEAKSQAARAAIQRRAANVLLVNWNAPAVVANSLPKDKRFRAKKALRDADGGLKGVLGRYNSGLSTPAEDAALFTPWAGREELTVDQQDAIVDMMSDHNGDYGWDLWDACASEADKRTHATERKREEEAAPVAEAEERSEFSWF